MTRCPGGGHNAILKATEQIFRECATALHGYPKAPGRPEGVVAVPQFDQDLYDRLCQRTILWNADAAADEILVAHDSTVCHPSADALRPLLPQLKFVNRDKAHACRRILKRPWWADARLKEVHLEFKTMFSLIRFSDTLQAWYIAAQKGSSAMRWQRGHDRVRIQPSLAWCEMRFDSAAKPLTSAVLTIDAVIMTAIRNCNERMGQQSGGTYYYII